MQLSWAAVASYCQHESSATTAQHVGHHEHQHDAGVAAVARLAHALSGAVLKTYPFPVAPAAMT